jgi:uncharacterized protein (DUF2062 family)
MILAYFILGVLLLEHGWSQVPPQRKNSFFDTRPDRSAQTNIEIQRTLVSIERGVSAGTPESFFPALSEQVWMSIATGERGIYSSNQALAILKNFFASRRPISFEFSKIDEVAATPFATGRLVFAHKGKQVSAQVYVSLEERESRWMISQFNIY